MFRVLVSTSAAARLAAATRFLEQRPPSTEVLIVGASRGAADDLARALGRRLGATFGLSRFSLTELAARSASVRLAGARRAAGSAAGSEAIAVRAVFDAVSADELTYFAPVASLPGFPRALSRTIHELRMAGISRDQLSATATSASRDLGRLMARVEEQFDLAASGDRAALFHAAAEACAAERVVWTGRPLLLLDVAADSQCELAFIEAVIKRAPEALATVPAGDERVLEGFVRMGAVVEDAADTASPSSDLAHLRRYVFTNAPPPVRDRAGDVRMFSAPGEGREALEIVRRVLREAERGIPFDEMAVFLRTPQQYLGLIEHACARADVPVYFDRGTRRPDPAGRAFVALLSCAVEGLSAKRFDEYLSLGQVPRLD